MSVLWTSQEMQAATLGRATRAFEAVGISIDTRTLKPGDLFVALQGDARDGHEFVSAALAKGAGAAMVSHVPDGIFADAPLLNVAHTMRGLEDLGRAGRGRARRPDYCRHRQRGQDNHKGNASPRIGCAWHDARLSVLLQQSLGRAGQSAQLPQDSAFGVFEIGMNHFGEIRTLVGFTRPVVAIVTTIAPAHLEYFGSMEAIADAKSEIFEGLAPGGTAIVPADNPCTERLLGRARQANVVET